MSALPDALSPASAPSNNVSLAQSAAASPDAVAFGVSSKMANGADDGAGARGGDREACWFWFHNRHCSVVQEQTVTSLVLSGNPSRSNLKDLFRPIPCPWASVEPSAMDAVWEWHG